MFTYLIHGVLPYKINSYYYNFVCFKIELEIGFLNTSYTISEDTNGLLSVQIGVISGNLQTSLAIKFFLHPTELVEGKASYSYL